MKTIKTILSEVTTGIKAWASATFSPSTHSHLKSQVTDLFNSNNTWTGDNTYSSTVTVEKNSGDFLFLKSPVAELGSTPASATPATVAYRDKNDDNLGYMGVYYDTDGSNLFRLYVRNKYTSGAPSTSGTVDYAYFGLKLNADKSKEGILKASFRPYDNNTHDLGSSSYQWKSIYAKDYYYNGVAWGLDKENNWTTHQKITNNDPQDPHATLSMYNSTYTKGSTLNVTDLAIGTIYFGDGGQKGLTNSLTYVSTDLTANGAKTLLSLSAMENTASSGTRANVIIQYDKNDTENPRKVTVQGAALPYTDATFPLGTSSFRWKTFNGVNPGALSLPDNNKQMVVDTTGWSITGGTNIYTPSANGWLHIRVSGATELTVRWTDWRFGDRRMSATATDLGVTIPVVAGIAVDVVTVASGFVNKCAFFPCLGNV